jgi:gas vesicle protein
MPRQESAGGGTVMLAFLMGAVAGAAVALLFAPAAGDETRQYLGEKAREGRDKATEAARQGREFVNRQRDTVKSAIDRGREAYEHARGSQDQEPA